jgi:hypothetical protein
MVNSDEEKDFDFEDNSKIPCTIFYIDINLILWKKYMLVNRAIF